MISFQTPSVDNVSPLMGPESGGTLITIQGSNLHIGGERKVTIGTIICDIDEAL